MRPLLGSHFLGAMCLLLCIISSSSTILSHLPLITEAHSSYKVDIPNGDRVTRLGIRWSAVGHVSVSGPSGTDSPGLNPFGEDFQKQNHFWTRELCEMDSDGDGQTNGFELGDPECEWSKDQVPSRSTLISHPGFVDSMTTWIPGAEDGSAADAGGALSGSSTPPPAPTRRGDDDNGDDNDGGLQSMGSGRRTASGMGSERRNGGRNDEDNNNNDDDDNTGGSRRGSAGSSGGRGRGGRGSRGGNTGGNNRSPVSTPAPRQRATQSPPTTPSTTTLPPGGTFAKKVYKVIMTFAKSVEEIRADQTDILARVAIILKVQTDQVSILSIVEGSAVVTFQFETDEGEYKDAAQVKSMIQNSDSLDAYGLQTDTLEAAETSPAAQEANRSPSSAAPEDDKSNVVVIAVVISLVVLVAGVAVVVVCVLMRGRSSDKSSKSGKKRKGHSDTAHRKIYETEGEDGFDELERRPTPQPGYPPIQQQQHHHLPQPGQQQQQPQAYPQPQQQYQHHQSPPVSHAGHTGGGGLQFPVHANAHGGGGGGVQPMVSSSANSSAYHTGVGSSSYGSSSSYPVQQQQPGPTQHRQQPQQYSPKEAS